MDVKVIALDLEQTLIDNSLNRSPRPGLFRFLSFCQHAFSKVVIFTTVETEDAREVFETLYSQGYVPEELYRDLTFVEWRGEYKDLRFVNDALPQEIVLVDDDVGWIHPEQQDNWVAISPWDGKPDEELDAVRGKLQRMLQSQTET